MSGIESLRSGLHHHKCTLRLVHWIFTFPIKNDFLPLIFVQMSVDNYNLFKEVCSK